MDTHIKTCHPRKTNICKYLCFICSDSFDTEAEIQEHFKTHPSAKDWTVRQSAHEKSAIVYTKHLQLDSTPEILLREEYFTDLVALVNNRLEEHPSYKVK